MHVEQSLRDQVALATGRPQDGAPIVQLKGDASNRSYLRVGAWPDSHVVMVMPARGRPKSEEASKGEAPHELPFVNVHRYLEGLGVRVPRILRYDAPAGLMVLEDLGDVTFERALAGRDDRGACTRRRSTSSPGCAPAPRPRPTRAAWPSPAPSTRSSTPGSSTTSGSTGSRRGAVRCPSRAERERLDAAFAAIARRLAAAPRGFTHRDYQSRNLMVTGGELVVIDFQDALQGPRQYDLVALLRDSYVELERAFVEAMIDRWLQAYQQESGGAARSGGVQGASSTSSPCSGS